MLFALPVTYIASLAVFYTEGSNALWEIIKFLFQSDINLYYQIFRHALFLVFSPLLLILGFFYALCKVFCLQSCAEFIKDKLSQICKKMPHEYDHTVAFFFFLLKLPLIAAAAAVTYCTIALFLLSCVLLHKTGIDYFGKILVSYWQDSGDLLKKITRYVGFVALSPLLPFVYLVKRCSGAGGESAVSQFWEDQMQSARELWELL